MAVPLLGLGPPDANTIASSSSGTSGGRTGVALTQGTRCSKATCSRNQGSVPSFVQGPCTKLPSKSRWTSKFVNGDLQLGHSSRTALQESRQERQKVCEQVGTIADKVGSGEVSRQIVHRVVESVMVLHWVGGGFVSEDTWWEGMGRWFGE